MSSIEIEVLTALGWSPAVSETPAEPGWYQLLCENWCFPHFALDRIPAYKYFVTIDYFNNGRWSNPANKIVAFNPVRLLDCLVEVEK